jgi:hypothetical protein
MELNKTKVSDLAAKINASSEALTQYLSGESSEEANQLAESLSALEVFNSEQLAQRDDNIKKTALKGQEGTIKGSVLGDVDKKIAQATGQEKQEGESTIDFINRAYSEKFKAEGKKPNEEIESLRAKLSEKESAIQNLTSEIDGIKDQYSKEKNQFLIDSKIDSYINEIQIDASDEMLPAKKEFLKFQLLKSYEPDIEDGQLVFKQNGKVVTDSRTASPLDPAKIVKDNAPKFVEVKQDQQQKPNGSGFKNKPIESSGKAGSIDFDAYNSKEEFKNHLTESGISLNSEEGQKLYVDYVNHKAGYAETKK